ncbi:endonuclease domain-containing protein [Phenylobacterium terrae]|uniref:Endonuclease domain-containing protein n=1 Tax=Phenylobacterium terrae TaxID=2665495 RepID=A0ABW4N3N0_9CAUL
MRGAPPQTIKHRARALRRSSTDAEKHLWAALRAHRLGGWKWRRQVPIGPYIVDFLCPAARLVVEIDGGQHDVQVEYDAARTLRLEAHGLRVLRFWNRHVLRNRSDVCEIILAACDQRPLPPRSGGRG